MCFTILNNGEGFFIVLPSVGGDGIGEGPPLREDDRDSRELLSDEREEKPEEPEEKIDPRSVIKGRLLVCDLERFWCRRFLLMRGSGRLLFVLLMVNSDEHRRSSGLDRQLRSPEPQSDTISPLSAISVFFVRSAISTISQIFVMRASSNILLLLLLLTVVVVVVSDELRSRFN